MNYIGIDIGSTAAKVVVLGDNSKHMVMPAGWNSKETAAYIKEELEKQGIPVNPECSRVVATGYGRMSVFYADKQITEITCHGRGGRELAGDDCTIIDVGGQDTKVIQIEGGRVKDFLMNDKCSAGTGKFVEIMANRLGTGLEELFQMAERGTVLPISSLCTVFAESEIIGHIGAGHPRENIAAGIVDSVASKVAALAGRKKMAEKVILTGGLSGISWFAQVLGKKLMTQVETQENGRYAGALGAALLAESLH